MSFDNVAISGNSTAGIKDLNESSDVDLYPNPATGKFIIDSKNLSSMEIFNLSGEKIYSVPEIQNADQYEIDLSGYPKGIYLVKIVEGKNVVSKKIILQ